MFIDSAIHIPRAWHLITRLGEAQVVLPIAVVGGIARVRTPDQGNLAMWWAVLLGVAVLITVATKLAFIGWGLGSAELDFTGVSGHAMLATAVYPLAMPALAGTTRLGTRRLATAVGVALAILVGVSRLMLGVHSLSEVVAGWLLGGAACAGVPRKDALTADRPHTKAFVPLGLALVVTLFAAPSMNTHALVTQAALNLSGHAHPYTRAALLRRAKHVVVSLGPTSPSRPRRTAP